MGIVDQQAGLAVGDLVLDAANPAADHRPPLPHSLGDGEAEPLGDALLEDHVGAALDRVDHRSVFVDVVHRQAYQVGAAAALVAHPPPRLGGVAVDHRPLGVVGDPAALRPRQDQVDLRIVEVALEHRQRAARILESVPAGDLGNDPGRGGNLLLLQQRGLALDPARGAVGANEHRRSGETVRGEADRPQDRVDALGLEVLVLRREGIDDRRHEPGLRPLEPFPEVLAPREDVGVGLLDVAAQEVPGAADELVGLVDSDVAAPDDLEPGPLHRRRQPSRLRVVQVDDVVGLAEANELGAGRRQGRLVEPARLLVEVTAVAGVAVEAVVDALGDGEELGCLAQHDPAGVDAGAANVGEQRPQHLRHAAATEGGADVPDRPPLERLPGPHRSPFDLVERLAQQRAVAVERGGRDGDELRQRHSAQTSIRPWARA